MQRAHDRIKETTTVTGTGDVTLLGAVTGFNSFGSVFQIGEPLYYAIVGTTEWEVGRGYLSSTTVLVREVVFESSNFSGSPPNVVFSPVSFSAGTKDAFITIPAERIEEMWTKGQVTALIAGLAMP